MSGSGGGGYIPSQRTVFICESSIINTNVSSIDLDVLNKHFVGDVLDVKIGESGSLILEDGDGEILGAILHINTTDIINCIKNGYKYKAEVISISGPACKVQIKSK
jgi:hypothetical protein